MYMKKKCSFCLAALLAVVSLPAVSEVAFGAEGGVSLGQSSPPALFTATVRFADSPWVFAVTAIPFDLGAGANADWWFLTGEIASPVSYYVFAGVSAGLYLDDFEISAGGRIGFGVDWFILDEQQLELYVQLAWNPYFGFRDDDGMEGFIELANFPLTTGARWWFR